MMNATRSRRRGGSSMTAINVVSAVVVVMLTTLSAASAQPFGSCQGHCNSNADCQKGLVCVSTKVVGGVPECPGADGNVCVSANVPRKLQVLDESKYAPDLPKLGLCQGDCDRDSDCMDGYVCMADRKPHQPVPGCADGDIWQPPTDFCILPTSAARSGAAEDPWADDVPIRDLGFNPPQLRSNPKIQLKMCQGDCNDDHDCEGHLICLHRDNLPTSQIEGCSGTPSRQQMDFCVLPHLRNYGRQISRYRYPLRACEGHCTRDADCGFGLRCSNRAVGCRGNGDGSTNFCVPDIRPEPTPVPYALPTQLDSTTYEPGKLTTRKYQLLLSRGLDAKALAVSDTFMTFHNGRQSDIPYHRRPDGAATFPNPDGSGGFAYVSNSEHPDPGQGGVGAIYFDKDGRVLDYRMLLKGTRMNCSGGRTFWNTWVTNEEYDGGQIWQVHPFNRDRPAAKTQLGKHGGAWESFAYDRRPDRPIRFFATEDTPSGALVRHTPYEQNHPDPWDLLHADGHIEYLVMKRNSDGANAGTFRWTKNRSEAKDTARAVYPHTEGIDIRNGIMYFVCKKIFRMFTLDLDAGTWTSSRTDNGLFDGGPDQLQRIIGDDRDMLYFTEEQGIGAGVHARDSRGRFYVVVSTDELPGETTGLAFSPDGRFMFMAYQDTGKVFQIWRRDGKPFQAERLDVRYHHVPQ